MMLKKALLAVVLVDHLLPSSGIRLEESIMDAPTQKTVTTILQSSAANDGDISSSPDATTPKTNGEDTVVPHPKEPRTLQTNEDSNLFFGGCRIFCFDFCVQSEQFEQVYETERVGLFGNLWNRLFTGSQRGKCSDLCQEEGLCPDDTTGQVSQDGLRCLCEQELGPVSYPYLDLIAPATNTFVPLTSDLCVEKFNEDFDNLVLSLNEVVLVSPVIEATENGQKACFEAQSFSDGANTITITDGELEIARVVQAGALSINLMLQDAVGAPFLPETSVVAQLSDNSQVSSTGTTSSGSIIFENLPSRTITFVASGANNEFGSNGANPFDTSTLIILMQGFNDVSPVDNKDFSQGLDGWVAPEEGITVTSHVENPGPTERRQRRMQINQDLQLGTVGVEGPRSASYTFTSTEDACAIKLRYRFVTSEVPGGWFGSEYNDYFSVAIRAEQSGASVTEANTMNGLGLAAFNSATGSTAWRETTLALEESFLGFNDKLQVDLVVANVEDEFFDSQVYVDFIEEVIADSDAEDDPCACALCQSWFDREIADRDWIDRLPRCPCSIVEGTIPCTVRPTGATSGTGTFDGVNWDTDKAMNPCVDFGFHPGASACIRAAGPGGTGQQCCYGAGNRILEHGNAGAGTPDHNFPDHTQGDVDTYNLCCTKCPSLCSNYIGKTDGTPGARSDPRQTEAGCAGP